MEILISIVLAVLCIGLFGRIQKAEKEIERLEKQIERLEKEKKRSTAIYSQKLRKFNTILKRAKVKIKSLLPFQGIVDVKKEIELLKKESDEYAKSTKDKAKVQALKLTQKAEEKSNEAVEYFETLSLHAKKRAKEIAGDAIEAKDKSDLYKKAYKAIKNKIDGYQDEYIIPNKTVLDDLADDFESKDASIKFKKAKAHTKKLIGDRLSASCDYVETHRKTTAVSFVIDAFNGKVDTVLAKVRHDNFGKLKQEILDAFSLVNLNGKAFRNAEILSVYLEARLEELKWSVALQELKLQEREEQRQLREIMREEAKAKREFEKAIKETEKEEKALQKAKSEAEKQLKQATDDQKHKFEQQILELQQKLIDVEEKNKRALSMAQMTRQGHVYIISNIGSFGEDIFKIGLTRRLEPEIRVKELGDASVPFPFDIHAMIHSEDSPTLETKLHEMFREDQVNKINPRKEFFNTSVTEIRKKIEELGIDAHWTLTAEAKEYRETKALEKSMSDSGIGGHNT